MQLSHLRYFYEVAKQRGFTRAERTLRVQQSAISKMVQKLEGDVGARLLERSPQGVRLTPVGQRLYATCERLFAEVDRFAREVGEGAQLTGELRIATATHVATYLLPPVLRALHAAHPRLVPRVITGPSHLLERELEERRLDVGLFFKVAPSRLLARRTIGTFPCRIVVRRGRARDEETLETFIGSREVDDLGNRHFPTVRFLRKQGHDTEIRYSCNSLDAHRAWVAQGLGVSILPEFVIEEDLRAKRLEAIYPAWVYPAVLELVTRRGDDPSPARAAFEAALASALAPPPRSSKR